MIPDATWNETDLYYVLPLYWVEGYAEGDLDSWLNSTEPSEAWADIIEPTDTWLNSAEPSEAWTDIIEPTNTWS
jgi:hypothetical protein